MGPLPWPRCPRCHHPLQADRTDCGVCAEWPPSLVGAVSACRLEGPASRVVHALKYEGWTRVAPLLGRRIHRAIREVGWAGRVDGVVPMPTPPGRLRRRGFNPAALLAEVVAEALDRPLLPVLRRPLDGPRQVGLPPSERAANVRGAFALDPDSRAEFGALSLLLVDDVLTTGATAVEAAGTLASAGAGPVRVATFARALPSGPGPGIESSSRLSGVI